MKFLILLVALAAIAYAVEEPAKKNDGLDLELDPINEYDKNAQNQNVEGVRVPRYGKYDHDHHHGGHHDHDHHHGGHDHDHHHGGHHDHDHHHGGHDHDHHHGGHHDHDHHHGGH